MAESHTEDEKQRWKRNLVETHFFVQMFVVTVLLLLILYGGYYHAQSYIPVPQSNDLSIKLAYSLQFCGLTSVLTLIVAIAMVESKRQLLQPSIHLLEERVTYKLIKMS